MSTVSTTHIEIDDKGVAWIDDTNVKVIEIVIDKLAHGSSPEEIHFQYSHLSLAQIHAALAYYYDHQTEIEAEIDRRWREADDLALRISDSSLRQKLLKLKRTQTRATPSAITYRRRRERDTWHCCRNCSSWPTSDYEEKKSSGRFKGEFCNECNAKQKAGNCSL